MAKRGRPRGLSINPSAVEDRLDELAMTKGALAEVAHITPGHLADMLHRQKGASRAAINAMATALRCSPATIAPELSQLFTSVRPGDDEAAA